MPVSKDATAPAGDWRELRQQTRAWLIDNTDAYPDGDDKFVGPCPSCGGSLSIGPADSMLTYVAWCSNCKITDRELVADWNRDPPMGRVVLEWADTVTPERIEWLWTDRLPLHDLAVLAGEPGLGKSTTTTELAAQVTRGQLGGALNGQPRTVLIASAEDHFASVVIGRLIAAGADMARVANVKTDGELLRIPGDVEEIAAACRRLTEEGRAAALIIVDPISAFLEGVDSNRDVAVRSALAPLADLAHTEHVCVLAIMHLNKSTAGKLLDRLSGSGAFGAAPRSVLAFARNPDDPDGEQGAMRVIVHAKSNHGKYAPTLAVHIEAPMIAEVGATVSKLVFDGETDISPDDLRPEAQRDHSSGEDVEDAILSALASGPKPSREVKTQVGSECGVSARKVERAAATLQDQGDLIASRSGFPAIATWELAQLRHELSRPAVATEPVATGEPQQPRGIAPTTDRSSDTRAAASLLDRQEHEGDDPDPNNPELYDELGDDLEDHQ